MILVNIGSVNGLAPYGSKPSTSKVKLLMFICCQLKQAVEQTVG